MQKIKPIALATLLIIALIPATIQMFLITSASTSYTEFMGELNAASYKIRIPAPIEKWNGMLVVYCRGYVHLPINGTTFLTGTAPGVAPMNELVDKGYAIAASTYGAGGFCLQKGINTTYELTQYVIKNFNVTGKVFLVGVSMGASIAMLLGYQYPTVYSGVLCISGGGNLTENYETKMQIINEDDSALTARLEASTSPNPPYGYASLTAWRTWSNVSLTDIIIETGGTPTTVQNTYEALSYASQVRRLSIPVISVHGTSDAVSPYFRILQFDSAVIAAGHSSLHRLYPIFGGQHADPLVLGQIVPRLLELTAWSNVLNVWTTTVNNRSLKAYPDLKETIWQKNASMAPNDQYDRIGLHRIVKIGTAPKGVVFFLPGLYATGEQLVSNPSTDTYIKTENASSCYYWANRGFDVYTIDYRMHFVPKNLNQTQLSFMIDWGLEQMMRDIKEAVEKVKVVSGFSKMFMAGSSMGGSWAQYYAAKYWKEDLKGLILLDPASNSTMTKNKVLTNSYNLTAEVTTMNTYGNWSWEQPQQTYVKSPLNPGYNFLIQYALDNPSAPAQYPNGTLITTNNPRTGKPWTNITEWFEYNMNSGKSTNTYGGYGNVTIILQQLADSDRYMTVKPFLDSRAMQDWTISPFISFDFLAHIKEINIPVLGFRSALLGIPTYGELTNSMTTSDFTSIVLPNYGHSDVMLGTYSARDVSEPAFQWMIKRTLAPNLPTVNVTLTVVNGTSSYYNSTLTNMPLDYSIQNGNYVGWCVDKSTVMVRSVPHNVTFYSSLISNTLPSSINSFNWNAVNYILNHKQGSMQEIQDAIWYFVPDQVAPPTNEANAIAMINEAQANPNYIPTSGNILGIIAYSGSPGGVQNTIIEYRIP